MSEITYDMKKSIAKKINSISDKKLLVDIIHIIKAMNPTVPITENDNGIFITFNHLTQQTYSNIENYLHKNVVKKEDIQSTSANVYVPYVSDDYIGSESMMRLSNRERSLIKKQRYTNEIDNNNSN